VSVVVVLPQALVGYGAADVTASVAQPTPTPTTPGGDLQDFQVSPGLLGFIPPFLIAVACVGLFLSLTRQLRRVAVRQAQMDAAESAGGAPEGGTDGRVGLDGQDGSAGPDDARPGRA
jgi:hypothetical protein